MTTIYELERELENERQYADALKETVRRMENAVYAAWMVYTSAVPDDMGDNLTVSRVVMEGLYEQLKPLGVATNGR